MLAEVVDRAVPSTVTAVGLSTVMHSLLGLDADDRPLTPTITFADSRAWTQALRLRRDRGVSLYRATGTPLHPMAPLLKLVWFGEHRLDLADQVRRWISIKELTVNAASAPANAHTADKATHATENGGDDRLRPRGGVSRGLNHVARSRRDEHSGDTTD